MSSKDPESAIQHDDGGLDKGETVHQDVVKDVSHLTALTPEEKVLERKLVRKIDILIMPLIILVYLMVSLTLIPACSLHFSGNIG